LQIPQVSYSSSSSELSEKPRFEYFSRVVAPDNFQAKAMVDLVQRLNWTYVHAIAVTGSYGEGGIDSFRKSASERGICFDGDVHKIARNWGDVEFQSMIRRMRASNKARGVVMFVDEDIVSKILRNLDQLIRDGNAELKDWFWWIASDSWGQKRAPVSRYGHRAVGAITVAPGVRVLDGKKTSQRLGRKDPNTLCRIRRVFRIAIDERRE
jgi:hypothetical protein